MIYSEELVKAMSFQSRCWDNFGKFRETLQYDVQMELNRQEVMISIAKSLEQLVEQGKILKEPVFPSCVCSDGYQCRTCAEKGLPRIPCSSYESGEFTSKCRKCWEEEDEHSIEKLEPHMTTDEMWGGNSKDFMGGK